MSIFFKYLWNLLISGKQYAKVLLVFLAFSILIVSSCVIMSRTISEKLLRHVETSINDTQESILTVMSGAEIILRFMSDSIETMIQNGESIEAVEDYLSKHSSPEFLAETRTFGLMRTYGYFSNWDIFIDGGGWSPSAGYAPKERPWYAAAMAGEGDILLTSVYADIEKMIPVVSWTRSISYKDGRFLGVISLDIPISFINKLVTGSPITRNSYGFIMDEHLIIIAHPDRDLIGSLGTTNPDIANFINKTARSGNSTPAHITNYSGTNSLIYGRQIDNGWHICFVIPESEINEDLYALIAIVSLLGFVMASILSLLLIRIETARSRADLKNQQKSNFLTAMSHEIRTPMNAILGIAEAQLQEPDKTLPHSITEAFNRIYYAGSLLLQIIGDLLDLAKIEAGKLDVNADRYDVASMIYEVINLNKMRFDSKPIEFKLSVDEKIPTPLIGDGLRIKQILNNLLSNAFKYTARGEIEFSITAAPAADPANSDSEITLVMSVRDTGQGISLQDMPHLFEEYTRFNVTPTNAGTGLGLNITKRLVEMMCGEIHVQSIVDEGSTFTVRIPQKTNDATTILGKESVDNLNRFKFSSISQIEKRLILREHMPYGSVLIVDDVEMNLFVAKLLLHPYALQMDTATSGYEAIDKIKHKSVYDIIFMDHMMPKMDGIEATSIIRGLGYTGPIVALTANAVAGQAEVFLASGFDDFISKPIDIRILNTVVNKYVRDKYPELARNERTKIQLHKIGIDVKQGVTVFADDMNDYISSLHSFLKNAPNTIAKLYDVTAENMADYCINIHSLKSASAWICAEDIRKDAEKLEILAKSGDMPGIVARNEDFLNEVRAFISKLQAVMDSIQPAETDRQPTQ